MQRIHYFSYGSNMLTHRLRTRTPSASPVGLGLVSGRHLVFHKKSSDESAKCDMPVAGTDDKVIGVVFDLDSAELGKLDAAEGAGYGYERTTVTVQLEDQALQCITYLATSIDKYLLPYGWYRQLVLAGLLEHQAPLSYIDSIKSVSWQPDPKPDRDKRQEALLALENFRRSFPHLSDQLLGEEDA